MVWSSSFSMALEIAITRPVMTGISWVSGSMIPLLVGRLLAALRVTTRLPMGSMMSNSAARLGGVGRVAICSDSSTVTQSPAIAMAGLSMASLLVAEVLDRLPLLIDLAHRFDADLQVKLRVGFAHELIGDVGLHAFGD